MATRAGLAAAHVLPSEATQEFPRHRRIGRREGFRLAPGLDASSNKWFVVYVRPNESRHSRLGIIVSKKIAPNAVDRNFAKRLVREGFRRSFPPECALDIIVRVKRQISKDAANEVSGALFQLLRGVQSKCGNC